MIPDHLMQRNFTKDYIKAMVNNMYFFSCLLCFQCKSFSLIQKQRQKLIVLHLEFLREETFLV